MSILRFRNRLPQVLAALVLSATLALSSASPVAADSVPLSGGSCEGYGASYVASQPYGFSTTVNYCGGSSWRWIHAVFKDGSGVIFRDYDPGWSNTMNYVYIPGSPPAPATINAGHQICETVSTCGSSDFSVSP